MRMHWGIAVLLTIGLGFAMPASAKGVGCEYSKDKTHRRNGKLHGKVPCLSESGMLMKETTFKNGVENGPFKILNGKGALRYSGTHKNCKRHGRYTQHWRDGRAQYVTTFKNGVAHGYYAEYCGRGKTDAQPKVEGHYRNGEKRHGKWKAYDCRSGMLRDVNSWANDKRHGEALEYHFRSKALRSRRHWVKGDRHGLDQRFNKDGTMISEKCVQHGRVVKGLKPCGK